MVFNLKLIRVNTDYCDYLRNFDSRVAYNKNENEKIELACCNYSGNLIEFAPFFVNELMNNLSFCILQIDKLN